MGGMVVGKERVKKEKGETEDERRLRAGPPSAHPTGGVLTPRNPLSLGSPTCPLTVVLAVILPPASVRPAIAPFMRILLSFIHLSIPPNISLFILKPLISFKGLSDVMISLGADITVPVRVLWP